MSLPRTIARAPSLSIPSPEKTFGRLTCTPSAPGILHDPIQLGHDKQRLEDEPPRVLPGRRFALLVSGVLLSLREIDHSSPVVSQGTGDRHHRITLLRQGPKDGTEASLRCRLLQRRI